MCGGLGHDLSALEHFVWPETRRPPKLHAIGKSLELILVRWLISCVLVLSISAGHAATAEARSSFMWVLRDKDNSITIVGYPKWVPTGASPVNLPAASAIRRSGRIFTDEPGTPSAGAMMRLASMMACEPPLSARLPKDILAKVRALSVKAGVDFEELEPGCAMYAAARLAMKLYNVPGYQDAKAAVEVAEIMELGAIHAELVTFDDHLGIFETIRPDEDAELLSGVVFGFETLGDLAAGTYQAWIAGDEPTFQEVARRFSETDPVNIRLMGLENAVLASRIADLARTSEDAVVLVRGASLLGKDGVLARLKKMGFSIHKVRG